MSANGDNKDWFGIPYIYSDHDPKRNSWHITDTNDNRLMEDIKIRKQDDGWYLPPSVPHTKNELRLECVSDPSVVDGNGNATPGEQIIETFYLPKVKEKGYLYKDPDSKDANGNPSGDFGDIEVTWRFKAKSGQVELVPGGLRQTNDSKKVGKDKQVPACCEAMSYHFKLDPAEGRPRCEKDTDHKDDPQSNKPVGYADHAFEKKNAVPSFLGNEVIQKAVLYRVAEQDAMKLELYFDGTGTGNKLKKILEVTDNSDWGPTRGYTYIGKGKQGNDKGNKECRGDDESFEKKALTAARVAIGFRFDGNLNDFSFKDCSVRSIDPSKPIHPAASEELPAPDKPEMHF